MQTSKIEWLRDPITGKPGFSINPVKGLCPVACRDNQGKEYCYARRMYLNPYYKNMYAHPEIRLDLDCFLPFLKTIRRKPSRIFVCSTIEPFGPWVKGEWLKYIFVRVSVLTEHTFIFLTKRPAELMKWSPFPKNCHVGVSVTNQAMHNEAIVGLAAIEAMVKFLSFEPLLGPISLHSPYDLEGIQWVILGQRTPVSARTAPKIEWVREIVEAADKAGVPVFLKNKLEHLLPFEWQDNHLSKLFRQRSGKLRQEMPKQGDYRQACGCAPRPPGAPLAEDVIRQNRDRGGIGLVIDNPRISEALRDIYRALR